MPEIKGLAHIGIHVREIDPVFEWYRDKFGFEPVLRFPSAEAPAPLIEEVGGDILLMHRAGLTIELIAAQGHQPDPLRFKSHAEVVALGGIGHLCLEVDDCVAAAAELVASGVPIDLGPNRFEELGWTSAHFHDIEGNDLEIFSYDREDHR